MHHPCPECEYKNYQDYSKYGFTLHTGYNYWTKIEEVKKCCAIKVQLVSYDSMNVIVEYNGTNYTLNRNNFMKSSWRDIDSY